MSNSLSCVLNALRSQIITATLAIYFSRQDIYSTVRHIELSFDIYL